MTAYVRFRNALAWHAFTLAQTLTAAGHDVVFFCQKNSPAANWTETERFITNRELNLNRFTVPQIFGGLSALRKTIREFQPDILNPHCPPGHTYCALARKLEGQKMPLVRTIADPRLPQQNPTNRYLHERMTDGFVYTTHSSQRRHEQIFNLRNKLSRVILPGFEADKFVTEHPIENYRARFSIPEDNVLIGIVARMSPEKGQEVFLEALSLLTEQERSKTFCVMAGEDSRERGQNDLASLARKFGVEKQVAFLDFLADVRPLMSNLDIGLITSTSSEAVCRVALEYMSFSLPVITSDVNILPEVVLDGKNGWVFTNRDPHALAACLRQAIHSREERLKRGKCGFELVHSDFSTQNQLSRTLAYFEEVQSAKST